MNYRKYRTQWDRQRGRIPPGMSGLEFTRTSCRIFDSAPGVPADLRDSFKRSLAYELAWMDAGRPYYKFEPDLLAASLDARLEVPTDLFRFPHPVFAIYLPQEGPLLTYSNVETGPVNLDAVLVAEASDPSIGLEPGAGIRALATLFCAVGLDAPHETLIHLRDAATIEEALQDLWNAPPTESDLPLSEGQRARAQNEARDLVRIVFSACLFATVAMRFILRDVLDHDRTAHAALGPSDPRRIEVEARADRGGVQGYCITTRHLLQARLLNLCKAVDGSRPDLSTATGRELRFRHIRGAHWHTFPTAQNPEDRVQFLMPCLVRPDLPPKAPGQDT